MTASLPARLLACPFCGLDVTHDEGCFPVNKDATLFEVRCGNPGCYAHDPSDDSAESAIARWNRRAPAAAPSAKGVES